MVLKTQVIVCAEGVFCSSPNQIYEAAWVYMRKKMHNALGSFFLKK
jgi:hypothetical protein